MEDLSLENILDTDGIASFTDADLSDLIEKNTEPEELQGTEEENENDTIENDLKEIFKNSESVGSEEDNNLEDTTPSEGVGSSPKSDFFSSIAEALAEEGILPNLDDESIKKIKTPEELRTAIDEYIKSELSEQQQRIKDALDSGVDADVIKQYEGIIGSLSRVTEDDISAETEQAEEWRKRIIFQDYINRGFNKERAAKEVEKSLKNGTDIDDAIEALESNIEFFKGEYNKAIQQKKKALEAEAVKTKDLEEKFKNSLFSEKSEFFGDLKIDKATRQKIYDNISKPTYRNSDTGEYMTAVQKYESEHPEDFLVKVGLLYTLTDGFKSLDKLVGPKVKKELKKGFRELESKINNSSRDTFGNLNFVSNDSESYIGKGLIIDV